MMSTVAFQAERLTKVKKDKIAQWCKGTKNFGFLGEVHILLVRF